MEKLESKNKLTSFIEEIKELQRQEQSGEALTAHFTNREGYVFVPEELKDADMDMWEEAKRWESEGLETGEKADEARNKFEEYKDRVVAEESAEGRDDWSASARLMFVAKVANQISPILSAYLITELEKK